MSDVDTLMTEAQGQLDEHACWLLKEISALPAEVAFEGVKAALTWQVTQIKLRMVRADSGSVSVVYDYPDELHAFLRDPKTPKHLRDTLVGGHDVDVDVPASTFVRAQP